jgi:hypothetical protein
MTISRQTTDDKSQRMNRKTKCKQIAGSRHTSQQSTDKQTTISRQTTDNKQQQRMNRKTKCKQIAGTRVNNQQTNKGQSADEQQTTKCKQQAHKSTGKQMESLSSFSSYGNPGSKAFLLSYVSFGLQH